MNWRPKYLRTKSLAEYDHKEYHSSNGSEAGNYHPQKFKITGNSIQILAFIEEEE